MSKSKKKFPFGIIIFALIVICIIAVIIVSSILNKPAPIPDDAVGNTSGNINNRGLFCETDDYIFFSNSYDARKLYRMDKDGSNVKCIADVPVEFINVYGDNVYFYQTPGADNQVVGLGGLYGVCSTNLDGTSGMNNIDKAIVNSLILYGPNLYYQPYDKEQGLSLYKADPYTKEKVKLSDKRVFVSTPLNGKFLTYNEDIGYFLSAFNPESGQMELVDQEARVYNVIYEGGYVYYMNIDDSYKIYRMNLSNYEKEKITDCTVDLFNVYGDNIFYQRNSEENPAVVHIKTDGSNEREVMKGNFTNINCTSSYTYFYGFGETSPIYRVPTSGGNAEVFEPEVSAK